MFDLEENEKGCSSDRLGVCRVVITHGRTMLIAITVMLAVMWALGWASGAALGAWVHLWFVLALITGTLALAQRGRREAATHEPFGSRR